MTDQLLNLLSDYSFGIILFILLGLWFLVFRTKATSFESKADFDSLIAEGQPVVAEFFSNG